MGIAKLSEDDRKEMDLRPEVAMNIQIARRGPEYVVVVSGRIAIRYDENIVPELTRLNEALEHTARGEPQGYGRALERWTENLPTSGRLTPIDVREALSILGFIHLGPRYPSRSPRPRPRSIYGHLPFQGLASGADVFYRYEAYPTSRRIDLNTSSIIQPNTFASPELDSAFVNSGLCAVARYALPQLLPACWRYELRPPPGTGVHYGASVPLYGQSGGGVEVSFPSTFKNNGSIPPPHLLPIF